MLGPALIGFREALSRAYQSGCRGDARHSEVREHGGQDGGLDISDVICIANYLFQGRPPRLPCDEPALGGAAGPGDILLADWNNDGGVDISDVVRTAGFLFQRGPAHPLGDVCTAIPGCPNVDACEP